MKLLSFCSVVAGLSLTDMTTLLFGGCSMLQSAIADSPDEPSVDAASSVYLTILLLLYIGGLILVWRTLRREKKERLKPLVAGELPASGVGGNEAARKICCELAKFPAIDNKLIAEEMRRRIRDAISLGPTDPQIVAQLNGFIEKLNNATKRRFSFPGISTVDKHGCALIVFGFFSVVIVALNLLKHNCPILLIPIVLIVVYSGLIAAAQTPNYLRELINSSFLFNLITGIHELAGENVREAWTEAQKDDLFEVTFSDGHKEYFRSRRNWIVIMALAFMISLLMVALSTYILIPLTIYFILRNYLLVSANAVNYSTPDFSVEDVREKLWKRIRFFWRVAPVVVFVISGFDFEAAIGTLFVLSPMLFIPTGYQSYFNSHFSVAEIQPEPERSRRLKIISERGKKYRYITLVATCCWMIATAVIIIGAAKFYKQQDIIRKEKIDAAGRLKYQKAEEERRSKKKIAESAPGEKKTVKKKRQNQSGLEHRSPTEKRESRKRSNQARKNSTETESNYLNKE